MEHGPVCFHKEIILPIHVPVNAESEAEAERKE